MNRNEKLASVIGEAMGDAETIAKSALSMAIERTSDLNGNPIVTLVMMEALCKTAIEQYVEEHPGMAGMMQMGEGLDILRDIIAKGIDRQFREYRKARHK